MTPDSIVATAQSTAALIGPNDFRSASITIHCEPHVLRAVAEKHGLEVSRAGFIDDSTLGPMRLLQLRLVDGWVSATLLACEQVEVAEVGRG